MRDEGFWLEGKHYPFPESYTLGQTLLVTRITKDEFYKYSEALQEGTSDLAVLTAWAAVSVWGKHPDWTIDEVEAFVMAIEDFQIENGKGDDNPPPNGSDEQPESTDSQDNAAE